MEMNSSSSWEPLNRCLSGLITTDAPACTVPLRIPLTKEMAPLPSMITQMDVLKGSMLNTTKFMEEVIMQVVPKLTGKRLTFWDSFPEWKEEGGDHLPRPPLRRHLLPLTAVRMMHSGTGSLTLPILVTMLPRHPTIAAVLRIVTV